MKQLMLAVLALLLAGLTSCSEDNDPESYPFLVFKQGTGLTHDGDEVAVGGQMSFGISAVGGGYPITSFRVRRHTGTGTVTEVDRGMYIDRGGLDTVMVFIKSGEAMETWSFFIQNSRRDTASISLTVYKGEGSAYGPIHHYPSIVLGYASNNEHPQFLSLTDGVAYGPLDVAGHESEIDLAAFYYLSSGKSSPTLTCPAYPSALGFYPIFSGWPVKNSTVYDYRSVDNDLVTPEAFAAAANDSLLVAAFSPQNVSGLCKFCYTGKIVPFKTARGKYGLIRIIRADETDSGSMEIEIKVQP